MFTALAGHERIHPGTRLVEWQPASRFTDSGALYQGGDDLGVLAVRVRPDGYGLWVDAGVEVGFFLEYDTGTEPLPGLLDKIGRYYRLWVGKRHPCPVLFVLPTALRNCTCTSAWPTGSRPGRCGGCTPTVVAGGG